MNKYLIIDENENQEVIHNRRITRKIQQNLKEMI